ncbi:hypothetical protein Q1695_013533 [Nippostrongylus brasiliensis]|nr:hypothetical protein Q1695_013533 [Nippostrongylus brasiliensis]
MRAGGTPCPEPPHNGTVHKETSHWNFFVVSHGIMKTIVGEVDGIVRDHIIKGMRDPNSEYFYVRRYAWRNSNFLVLYFFFILSAVFIILVCSYRLLYNWSSTRRRERKKPKSLFVGFLMLILGIFVAVWCIIMFWEGLTGIQVQSRKSQELVDDVYIDNYRKSILCGTIKAESEALKMANSAQVTAPSNAGNSSSLGDEIKPSVELLDDIVHYATNCSNPYVHDLKQYLDDIKKKGVFNNTKSFTASGPYSKAEIKRIIKNYATDAHNVLAQVTQFANEKEDTEEKFINGNEYSSVAKILLLLTLALPGVLFLLCLTGIIILIAYSIVEQARGGRPSKSLYEFLAVVLQTYGYACMVVTALFFLTAALFFVAGYSSVFICDKILHAQDGDDLSLVVTVNVKGSQVRVNVKEAIHRCQHNGHFHEAFSMGRILPGRIDLGHSSGDGGVTSPIQQLMKILQRAQELKPLMDDTCLAINGTDFSDVLKQTKERQVGLKAALKDEKLKRGMSGGSNDAIYNVDNALRSNSPPCVHLASSLTTRGRFCKEKPPYFQGLWMACGLTAIMSIHTFPAMFDGSDMMRPKDRSDDDSPEKGSKMSANEEENKEKGKEEDQKPSKEKEEKERERKSKEKVRSDGKPSKAESQNSK